VTGIAYDLTPTEDLAMDVLVARWRLGENIWTFSTAHKRVLEKLQSRGYVNVIHGVIENTIRAGLTELGRDLYLVPDYVPPIFREVKL
jgi:hypothetical protein